MNQASDPKLKNTIDEMYRRGAEIGDGGLADAVRYELETGKLVGGKSHIKKCQERIKNLKNLLRKNNMNQDDTNLASNLLQDLINALKGKK